MPLKSILGLLFLCLVLSACSKTDPNQPSVSSRHCRVDEVSGRSFYYNAADRLDSFELGPNWMIVPYYNQNNRIDTLTWKINGQNVYRYVCIYNSDGTLSQMVHRSPIPATPPNADSIYRNLSYDTKKNLIALSVITYRDNVKQTSETGITSDPTGNVSMWGSTALEYDNKQNPLYGNSLVFIGSMGHPAEILSKNNITKAVYSNTSSYYTYTYQYNADDYPLTVTAQGSRPGDSAYTIYEFTYFCR